MNFWHGTRMLIKFNYCLLGEYVFDTVLVSPAHDMLCDLTFHKLSNRSFNSFADSENHRELHWLPLAQRIVNNLATSFVPLV